MLINQYVYPPKDGGKRGIYYRLKYLSRKLNLHLFFVNTGDAVVGDADFSWAKNTIVIPQLVKPSFKCNKFELLLQLLLWLESGVPRQSYILLSKKIKQNINNYIIENNISVILMETPFVYTMLDLKFIKEHNVRLVSVFHNVENIYFQEISTWPKKIATLEKRRIEKIERCVLDDSDLSICISPYDKEWYENNLNAREIKYLPSVLPKADKMWKNSETGYIVFFSQLSFPPNYLGLMWFLENVFAKYCDIFPGIKLKITGKISNEKRYSIEKFKNVEMTGFLNDGDFDLLLQNTLFSIAPINQGSGVKIKLLEALSYGIPTIATRHCYDGIRFKTKSGDEPFVVADNADEFLQHMIEFTRSRIRREKISNNAYDFYEKEYSSEENINNWMKNIIGEGV